MLTDVWISTAGIVAVPLLLAVLPAVAWSWRALFAVVLVIGGILALLWLEHGIVTTRPDYREGRLDFAGLGLLAFATIGFCAMTAARVAGLGLQGRGWSRLGTLWADALGLLVAAGSIAGPTAFHELIELRPPPQACLARPVPVRIGEHRMMLPHSPMISLYLDADSRTGSRRLFSPRHQRDICRRTGNGERPIEVLAVGFLFRASRQRGLACESATLPWERELCRLDMRAIIERFPQGLLIFKPGALEEGQFGIKEPTYRRYLGSRQADSWKDQIVARERNGTVARYADGFVVANAVAGIAGERLTAYCRNPDGNGDSFCQVDSATDGGLRLKWEFSAVDTVVSDRLVELHERVRSILASFEP